MKRLSDTNETIRRASKWWNREIESDITIKRRLHQLWLRNRDGHIYEMYKCASAVAKSVVQVANREADEGWVNILQRIEECEAGKHEV